MRWRDTFRRSTISKVHRWHESLLPFKHTIHERGTLFLYDLVHDNPAICAHEGVPRENVRFEGIKDRDSKYKGPNSEA